MAHHSFLQQLGLFAVPRFLTSEECRSWRGTAEAAGGVPARVYVNDKAELHESRSTTEVAYKTAEMESLEERLRALWPDLARHFGVELAEMEHPRCLVYKQGDFFRMHRDAAETATREYSFMERRRISVVVFLNQPDDPEEPYEGGALSFFGLTKMPGAENFGFPADAETGLLIAFPSTMLHEVSPVNSGKRFTMVTWILGPEEDCD